MRIIAGSLKGRNFDTPSGHHTHPMGDKVKGALFNVLGDIEGLTVLDAFAGSGALSFEAISRGAKSVVAIDLDLEAYKTIVRNVEKLKLGNQVTVLRKNTNGWARNTQHRFDLVIADPPYDDFRPTLLQRLVLLVEQNGTFVLSWPNDERPREFEGVSFLTAKHYAGAQLVFYRRTG